MLDVLARDVTFRKRMVSDVQVKTLVGVEPVKFKPEQRKTHSEVAYAVTAVVGSFSDFLDPAVDMPVSEDDSIEENTPSDAHDYTIKDLPGPSFLQRMQELY